MYTFRSDQSKARVIMHFDARDAKHSTSIEKELADAIAAAKDKDGKFDIWIEFSSDAVWSQDIAARAQELLGQSASNGMRKGAIIPSSALQKLQMNRVSSGNAQFRIFEHPAEAERWLAA